MSLHPPHFPSPAPTPDNSATIPPAQPSLPASHALHPGAGPASNDPSLAHPAGQAQPAPSTRAEESPARQPIMTAQDLRDQKTREEIEKRLLRLTQDLYELEICAGAVMKDQEDRIPQFLFNINEHYAALNDLARQLRPQAPQQPGADGGYEPQNGSTGDRVPRKVVEDVDGYRNPHAFTKTTLQRATGENQYALGRILGLESFRRQLESGLKEQMPYVPLPPRTHRPSQPIKAERVSLSAAADGQDAQTAARTNAAGEANAASAPDANGHAAPGSEVVKLERREGEYEGMVNGAL